MLSSHEKANLNGIRDESKFRILISGREMISFMQTLSTSSNIQCTSDST
jgi:hypothetical protein